jgi:hypothetical protein
VADSVLNDVSTALDLIVLEQLPAGGFCKAGHTYTPTWFDSAFGNARASDARSLLDAFPVLDAFLQEAEALWSGGADGRLDSEPFIVVDRSGSDVPVAATALAVRGRRYLILQSAAWFDERRRDLQTARDQALAHERTIKQLHGLQKPIATLARLVDDLELTSSDRHAAATAIRQQVQVLRGLLDDLPRAPRGATPGGG